MTLLKNFASACELADQLPALLGDLIDLEVALGRRFREDSLTDLVIASFLQIGGLPVVVQTPNEKRTGSDFDLDLVDPATRTSIRYRIQAKRLGVPTASWRTRSYRELGHPNGTGAQMDVLCDLKILSGPIPTHPLYAFYNPASVCTKAGVQGIALADAFMVQELREQAKESPKPRPPYKRLARLQHLFFGLDTILCPPPTATSGVVATPAQSLQAYNEVARSRSEGMASYKRPYIDKPGPMLREQWDALRRREEARIQKAEVPWPRLIVAASMPTDEDFGPD